jgi:hypothetical protein
VAGYPAAYNDLEDRRDLGQINLSIGVSDDQTVSVSADTGRGDHQRAPDLAMAAAEEMIKTLREGQ